ncbi:unnamed protein product [Dibothriocephalus latus]|uniref:Uncharacterized protein n=1 Tax=Dibothriocephalus latus TaxID=60516 RepID=A0A3P7LKQ4_DIBLA|nr:unnamed protein product [Dibothriocephalus latus]
MDRTDKPQRYSLFRKLRMLSFRDKPATALVRTAYLRKLYSKWSESQTDHPMRADGDIPNTKSVALNSAFWPKPSNAFYFLDLPTSTDEPLPMEDVVSSLAEEVLVEVSEEFKAQAIESYIDNHASYDSLYLPDTPTTPTETQNSTSLNSALKSLQEDWFRATLAKDATFETMEAYLQVLSHFGPYVLQRVVNFTDKAGNTLLHLAIVLKSWPLIVVLLSKCDSCHVDHFNNLGFTPLMTAAFSISQPMSVDEHTGLDLLIKQSNLNLLSKNRLAASALFLAASNRKTEMVGRLINAPVHADANLTDAEGNTPLMIAVKRNNWEIVRLLVTHADINLEQKNNVSFCILFSLSYCVTTRVWCI